MERPMGRNLRVFAAVGYAAFSLLGVNPAAADCPPENSGQVAGGESYRYVLALAQSFTHARAAFSKAPMESPGGTPGPDQELSRLAGQIQSAAEDYKCAVELVAPYAKSSDESVALSAEAAAVTYGALIQLDDQKRQLLQSVLDGKLTREDLTKRLARGLAQTRETWRVLLSATVMGTFALVEPPEREEEKVSRLRISDAQRKSLAEKIEKDFGAVLREKAKRGEPPPVAAARVLYGFVSNEDWKSSNGQ